MPSDGLAELRCSSKSENVQSNEDLAPFSLTLISGVMVCCRIKRRCYGMRCRVEKLSKPRLNENIICLI